jgi:hypothetical protein
MRKLFYILPVVLVLFACKKKGCTDATADNYSADNEKNDKSCLFSAPVVFYMDTTTAHKLNANGFASVVVSMDGNQSGSFYTSKASVHIPGCSDTIGYRMRVGMGSESIQSGVTYVIKTPSDSTIGAGTIDLDASSCKIIPVVY